MRVGKISFLLTEDGVRQLDGKNIGERTLEFIINRCRWVFGQNAEFQTDNDIVRKVQKHIHYVKTTKQLRNAIK